MFFGHFSIELKLFRYQVHWFDAIDSVHDDWILNIYIVYGVWCIWSIGCLVHPMVQPNICYVYYYYCTNAIYAKRVTQVLLAREWEFAVCDWSPIANWMCMCLCMWLHLKFVCVGGEVISWFIVLRFTALCWKQHKYIYVWALGTLVTGIQYAMYALWCGTYWGDRRTLL